MAAPGGGAGRESGPRRWGALSYPAFRRFWVANVARVFGLQFRFIGTGWLVVSSDGLDLPPIWLGVVGLAAALPTIALAVPAGALADRADHRRILLASQLLTSALSFALAALIWADAISIGWLLAWAIATGTLAAVAVPANSAIVPRLIDMRSIASAVALTSSIWNSMRVVGPAAAGLLIAWIGIAQAFFVTALGFALSALLIATLRLEPVVREEGDGDGGVREGLRFILNHRIFLATLGLSFFTSVFGSSYQTLLPVFADDVLEVGSQGFGFLEAAAGLGGFLGTLAILQLGHGRHAGATMLGGAALFGLFVAGFAGSRSLPLSMGLLFCGSFCASLYLNIGMTLIQLLVPDALRGRVMGVWSMTWFLSAVGGLPASALAGWIGAPLAVALAALSVTAFAGLLWLLAADLRQLPLGAPGDQAGTPASPGARA